MTVQGGTGEGPGVPKDLQVLLYHILDWAQEAS